MQARKKAVRRKTAKRKFVLKVRGHRFQINASRAGYSDRWGKRYHPHYKYRVIVKRLDGPKGEISFTFHDSHAAFLDGKKRLTDEDKVLAFRSYLEDALAYLEYESPDEFMRAYGYPTLKEAKRVYNACHRAYEKIRSELNLSEDELYDIINEIVEAENDGNLRKLIEKR